MVSGQMTRGAAISMALLAIIVLALIVLLAWPTHSASDSPVGTNDLAGPMRLSEDADTTSRENRHWLALSRPTVPLDRRHSCSHSAWRYDFHTSCEDAVA